MNLKLHGFGSTVMLTALVAGLSAQAPAPARPPAPNQQEVPTFRVQIDAVTMDVIARDDQGRFIADLKKDDFEIYEDGVKQEIASMTMSHGGRVTNVLEAPPPPAPEGVILPPVRRLNATSGRIFLFFVDDMHLQFQATPRVRDLFQRISKTLLHDGDMFGVVSSGPSSIAIDMTYDKRRMDDAIKKMTGAALKPSEIIETASGPGGPSELRYRAHTAFATMTDALNNLEKVHDRRKALVWVSEGYDFNPFQNSRLGLGDPNSPFLQNRTEQMRNQDGSRADSHQRSPAAIRDLQRCRSRLGTGRNHTCGEPRQRHDLHDRPSRPGRRRRHRRGGGSAGMGRVRSEVPGHDARAGGRDRRHRRGQSERLRQSVEADRRGIERLLRARVLLEQSRSHGQAAEDRGPHTETADEPDVPDRICAEAAATAGFDGAP